MKIYKYTLIFLGLIVFNSCTKDLGNYEYTDVNILSISGIQSSYSVRTNVDTLRINPVLKATMDEGDTTRYEYLWILQNIDKLNDTISTSRNLVFPVFLAPINHMLLYRVLDKKTGIVSAASSSIAVGTPFSRGLLIMGEDEEGYAEAEMLSMRNDTVHIKNLLSESGLPRLREPISFMHTGVGSSAAYARLWAITGSGSYYLDRSTIKGTPGNTFNKIVFSSFPIDKETNYPVVVGPQIATAAGAASSTSYRAAITKGGNVFVNYLFITGGDYYNDPINRTPDAPADLLPAAPYMLYMLTSDRMNALMWYDTKNHRFLNTNAFYPAGPSKVLTDGPNDVFPWNNASVGRQLVYAENTRNVTDGSTYGNSYAIMKDGNNAYYIYKFYVNGASPIKRAFYTIKSMATNFHTADFYAFSSNRPVVFYSKGNKLYAYDYSRDFERIYEFPELGSDEITMLKFDTQVDPIANGLYIATYNSTTNGRLRRFTVGNDANIVTIAPVKNADWSNMVKIRNVTWRAVD